MKTFFLLILAVAGLVSVACESTNTTTKVVEIAPYTPSYRPPTPSEFKVVNDYDQRR